MAEAVLSTFSMYGLTITKKLSYDLYSLLRRIPAGDREETLTKIVEQLLNQNLDTSNIQKEHIDRAIRQLSRPETALKNTETVLNVINAYDIPKVQYDIGRKKFLVHKVDKDFYPDAVHKTQVFKDRLDLLYYRTLRHELFTPSKFGQTDEGKLELVPIEYLLSEAKTDDVYVIGLLSQLTEGQFYLEDSNGTVKLDLKKANFQSGLIMEGSIVIANGNYVDSVFEVKDIGFPPPEPTINTRAAFGDVNTFGGEHPTTLKMSEKLQHYETEHQNETLVFLSDFWVDDIKVIEKYEVMLEGYSTHPPAAFIFCGHFLSFPPNATSPQKLKDGFKTLANLITRYDNILKESKFIFVPAPHDLGAPRILPRGSLPKSILNDFMKRVPSAILATNPCRIQFCTKEIVVLREDIVTKLCRNTLKFLPNSEVHEQYAKSIICQSHLIPLSLQAMPVYWKFDHVLQVFPTPDLIVVADTYKHYRTSYSDCHVINPGCFPKSDYTFFEYVPAENNIEICELAD